MIVAHHLIENLLNETKGSRTKQRAQQIELLKKYVRKQRAKQRDKVGEK